MSTPPRPLLPTDPEPPHGSVVMVESTTGTACQRFYSDGLYHPAGRAAPVDYAGLFLRSNGAPRQVFLVYETTGLDDD